MNTTEDAQELVDQLQERHKLYRKSISLFKAPFSTLKYFIFVLGVYTLAVIAFLREHLVATLTVLTALSSIVIVANVPGSHQEHVVTAEELALLSGWWIFLGILSSVGLGTGLHTFVLYLGPHIARITLTASECDTLSFDTYGEDAFVCPDESGGEGITFWQIVRAVQFEAILWGFGTAIGELPPYFVARAARLAGESVDELEDLDSDDDGDNTKVGRSWKQKLDHVIHVGKKSVLGWIEYMGFFGILLFASIPNPLFDLAGLTCGHFGVPFWRFFGATAIGKSIVKVHLQVFFVVGMFDVRMLQRIVSLAEVFVPGEGVVQEFFEKQKAKLHQHSETKKAAGGGGGRSIGGRVWDLFLLSMILYFVVSIIDSSVQGYLQQKHKAKEERIRRDLALASPQPRRSERLRHRVR
eukprot:TRINITY_DN10865_c0_g1_i1.p1 TRINITY_DN10865_c0_g1~~TRINITY_DN10865_c0_g1_i1.p1  ORF type:complete len:412 (+),score=73.72 TRINITY_DN10865_c0_g1_i1:276-1511(+)